MAVADGTSLLSHLLPLSDYLFLSKSRVVHVVVHWQQHISMATKNLKTAVSQCSKQRLQRISLLDLCHHLGQRDTAEAKTCTSNSCSYVRHFLVLFHHHLLPSPPWAALKRTWYLFYLNLVEVAVGRANKGCFWGKRDRIN